MVLMFCRVGQQINIMTCGGGFRDVCEFTVSTDLGTGSKNGTFCAEMFGKPPTQYPVRGLRPRVRVSIPYTIPHMRGISFVWHKNVFLFRGCVYFMSLNYKCLVVYKGKEEKKNRGEKCPHFAGVTIWCGSIWMVLLHSQLKHLLPVHFCVSPLKSLMMFS